MYFTLGTESPPGSGNWLSPFGEETIWIAYQVDDQTISPPQFPTDYSELMYFTARNDEDKPGPQVDSEVGTLIFNEVGVFSDELLQAIGNEVITTVMERPGLQLHKSSSVEYVTAGESFDWIIEYKNDSESDDDWVIITDTLPAGIQFLSATHAWNAQAISNGAPAIVTNPIPSSIATLPGGETELTFHIADAYRMGDLQSTEGGTLTLTCRVPLGIPSGTVYENVVCGVATNGIGIWQVCDRDEIEVRNPDLWIRKLASPTDPSSGDTVNYTLLLANMGLVPAENVEIEDELPPGVTYVPGSTFLVGPSWYSLGEPSVSGQILTWSIATGNPLTDTRTSPLNPGWLEGSSGDIQIQYKGTVDLSVPPGTVLTNLVVTRTDTPEDDVFPNDSNSVVRTPYPDPTVTKTGPQLAYGGDAVTWKLQYRNINNEDADNVYIIDTLPDLEPDGDVDVTFLSTTPDDPGPVQVFYHPGPSAPVPAFDPTNAVTRAAQGWVSSPAGIDVHHVAWSIGELARKSPVYEIEMVAILNNPEDGSELPPGTILINEVEIFSTSIDDDPTNNDDDFTTRIPGVDLALTKTGDTEGAFPGLAPGHDLTYTIRWDNTGTVNAYGLSITDTLPPELEMKTPLDNFAAALPEQGTFVDLSGNPIPGSIPVTRVVSGSDVTWYLGETDTNSTFYYRHIGIEPGTFGRFEVYTRVLDTITQNGTQIENAATIVYEGPDNGLPVEPEEYLDNNTDDTLVFVYLPDLLVIKTGRDLTTDDPYFTEAGRRIEYKLCYDNVGNFDAANAVLAESIPIGTTYVPGSLMGTEEADSVEFFDFNSDGRIDRFEVRWDVLPAPANYVTDVGSCAGVAMGLYSSIDHNQGGLTMGQFHQGRFGSSVTAIGDLDGDGITDLVLGGRLQHDEDWPDQYGSLWVMFMNADGTVRDQQEISHNIGGLGPTPRDQHFGTSVAVLGDKNGDNIPDLLVGGEDADVSADQDGTVYILYMNADGTVASHHRINNVDGGGAGSGVNSSHFGSAVAYLGDMNGDGIGDIAVGERGDNHHKPLDGKVHIVFLDANEMATGSVVLNDPNAEVGTGFGRSLAALGDLDSNGYTDLAVGDYAADGASTNEGQVHIYMMGPGGTVLSNHVLNSSHPVLSRSLDRFDYFGTSLTTGDYNGDGVPDLVIGAHVDEAGDVKAGGALYVATLNPDGSILDVQPLSSEDAGITLQNSDGFGWSVANIGDINFDGVDDLAVGATGTDVNGWENAGRLYLVTMERDPALCGLNGNGIENGKLAKTDAALIDSLACSWRSAVNELPFGAGERDRIGSGVTGVGDIDGNGVEDIVLGTFSEDAAGPDRGGIWLVFMGSNCTVNSYQPINPGDLSLTVPDFYRFGVSVEGLGLFNNDTIPDIAVSAHHDGDGGPGRGAVYLLHMDTDGSVISHQKISSTAGGFGGALDDYDSFGYSIASIGDVNGDGINDLAVGAPRDDDDAEGDSTWCSNEVGAVWILFMNADGTVGAEQKISDTQGGLADNLNLNDRFGHSVAGLGDVDGDGVPDIVVGAPQRELDQHLYQTRGEERGSVFVLLLNDDGTVKSSTEITRRIRDPYADLPINSHDQFGFGVEGLGDINGDGVPDLAVGAPFTDGPATIPYGKNFGSILILNLDRTGNFTHAAEFLAEDILTTNISNEAFGGSMGIYRTTSGTVELAVGHFSMEGWPSTAMDGGFHILTINKSTSATSGVYEYLATANSGLQSWRDMIVEQDVPEGTEVSWTILDASGSTILWGPNDMSGAIESLAAIDPAHTQILVRAEVSTTTNVSPCLLGWRATYVSTEKPCLTFQVDVDDPVANGQTTIDNTVNISTDTPETDYTNNDDEWHMTILLTDLAITKSVDRLVAMEGDALLYTLEWQVNGPNGAINASIEDFLPTGVTYVAGTASPAETNLSGSGTAADPIRLEWFLGDLSVGDSGTITIPVTINTNVGGTRLFNVARIENDRQETDYDNNQDDAETYVGQAVDINIVKDGPDFIELGGTAVYHLVYGNGGNVPAPDCVVTDTLPVGLSFLSSVPPASNVMGQVVSWHLGTLGAFETGTIRMVVQVGTNVSLVGETLTNYVHIATSTNETDLTNNDDDHEVPVLQLRPVSLSGFVFADGCDGIMDPVLDDPLEGVVMHLTGTDAFGNPVNLTNQTDASGQYNFSGLNPGTYTVQEFDPAGYGSVLAALGQVVNGTNSSVIGTLGGANIISGIVLNNGDRAIEYNFLDRLSSLGNLIWRDLNLDGQIDPGEPGISNVTVALLADVDGTLSNASNVASTVTDGNGLYRFDNLLAGDYWIQITDIFGVLSGWEQTSDDQGLNLPAPTLLSLATGVCVHSYDYGFNRPEFDLVKTLVSPTDRPALIGEEIVYALTLSNTGVMDIALLDLTDQYDTNFLSFVSAAPVSDDNTDDGVLHWTGLGPLATGDTLTVTARFAAVTNTPNGSPTTNRAIATVTNLPPVTGEVPVEVDAPVSVGDYVWLDNNRDGDQTGESGISNVTVILYNTNGVALATNTTDSSGGYLFTNLPPGSYYVEFVPPTGMVFSPTHAVADHLDSDADPGTGQTPPTGLIPEGSVDRTLDAGLYFLIPGIELIKATSTPLLLMSETAQFEMTVTNTGELTLTNVIVSDALAPGCDRVIASLPVNSQVVYSCSLSNVVADLTNVAVVCGDPVGAADDYTNALCATDEVPVYVDGPSFDVIKKLVSPAVHIPVVGETVQFELEVVNLSTNLALPAIDLADTWDTNFLQYVTASTAPETVGTGSLIWNDLGPIAPDTNLVITVQFLAVNPTRGDLTTNVVVGTVTNQPPITNEAPTEILEPALLVLKQLVSPTGRPANIGETVVFDLFIANTGEVDLVNVQLTDLYDTNYLSYAGVASSATVDNVDDGVLHWPTFDLDVSDSTNVQVSFTAVASTLGDLTTNWVVGAGETTNGVPVGPETNNAPVPVLDYEFAVSKTLISPTGRAAQVSETLTFRLTFSNTGEGPFDSFELADVYDPSLLSFVSATVAPDDAADDGILNWTGLGPLATNASFSIDVSFLTLAATGPLGTNAVIGTTTNYPPEPPKTNEVPYDVDQPGIEVTKTLVSPTGRPANVGETVIFALGVSNTSLVEIVNINVTDRYDTNFLSFVGASPATVDMMDDGSLAWSPFDLAPGSNASFTVTFTAAASTLGDLTTNWVVGAGETTNGVPVGPETNNAPVPVLDYEFAVSKTLISPTGRAAQVSETLTFRLTFSNTGEGPFDSFELADVYDPSLLSFVSATVAPDDAADDGILNWTGLGPLATNASFSIDVSFLTLAATDPLGTNAVIGTTTNYPPEPPKTNEVPYDVDQPGIEVTKTLVSPTGRPANVGETVIFALGVSNTSLVEIVNINVTDSYDTNFLSFVGASPATVDMMDDGSLAWSPFDLAPGSNASFTVTFTAAASTLGDLTTNWVVGAGETTNGVPVGPETNNAPVPVLDYEFAVSKTLISPTGRAAQVSETLTFRLTFSNTGEGPFDSFELADVYDPSLLSFVGATVAPDDAADDGILNWTGLGPLATNASFSIDVSFLTLAATDPLGTNAVIGTTTNYPPEPPKTNEVPYDVDQPGIEVTKTLVSPTGRPANVGETVIFALGVSNTSLVEIVNINVTDSYDTNFLSFVGASPATVDMMDDGSLAWSPFDLAPGSNASFTVTFTAAASTLGDLTTNWVVGAGETTNGVPVGPETNNAPVPVLDYEFAVSKTLISPTGRAAQVSETLTFRLTFSNTGEGPFDSFELADVYDPSLLSFVGATVAPDDAADDGILNWTGLGPLATNASFSIDVSFLTLAATDPLGTNAVIGTTTNYPPEPPKTNEVPYDVDQPGIEVTKTLVSPTGRPANVGETVIFALGVSNTSLVEIVNINVTDSYDTNFLSFVGASPATVDMMDDGSLAWSPFDLAPGSNASFTVTFTAAASTLGDLTTNWVVGAGETTNGVPVGPETPTMHRCRCSTTSLP